MPEKRHMHMCLLFKGREPATAPIGPTAQQSAVGYDVVSLEITVVRNRSQPHAITSGALSSDPACEPIHE